MTKTGGRSATVRHIAGEAAISVGMPNAAAPTGWRWVPLTSVARLESGHTPSRRHPEYWGGDIPWLSIRDAKANHGKVVSETIETTNEAGIENSSARVLPKGTVCLSRTASVGYVTIMGRAMATSQDFVNWVCSDKLDPRFLQYLLICEKPSLARFSSGAVHQTIYFPEVKAFHVCIPAIEEQQRIVAVLDEVFAAITTATSNAEKNLSSAQELFESILRLSFEGVDAPLRSLSDACERVTVGHVGITSPHYRTTGIPFLRTQNITKAGVRLDDLVYITPEFHRNLRKSALKAGDVLIARVITDRMNVGVVPATLGEANCANVICVRPGTGMNPQYLWYLIRSDQSQRELLGQRKGSAQQVVNTSVLKSWRVPIPTPGQQAEMVRRLDVVRHEIDDLIERCDSKLASLANLKQSLLHRAFTGGLTASKPVIIVPANDDWHSPEASAQILVFAHFRHVSLNRVANFGHVKAQKSLQAVEAWGGLDLGRRPIKDRAGPNDFPHMQRVEEWAKQNGAFEFVQRPTGGYDFRPLQNYGKLLDEARRRLDEVDTLPKRAIELLVDMDSDWAEIIVTTHAAWNNLVLDKVAATNDMNRPGIAGGHSA